MSEFLMELIMRRIKLITTEEILSYSKQYGFSISRPEAVAIMNYLKTTPIEALQSKKSLISNLEKLTTVATAKKADKLLNQLIKTYGLDYLFKD